MVSVITTVILLLSVLCCSSGSLLRSEEHKHSQKNALMFLEIMEENLIAEIRNFTATGYRSPLFDMWTKSVPYTEEMTRVEVEEYPPELTIIGCLACRTYLASLIRDIRAGVPLQQVADSAVSMCLLLMPFENQVCRNLIDLNANSLYYIIQNRPALGANEVCGLILQGECGAVDPMFNFAVSVSPHNPITAPKSVTAPRGPDELRIIHISDVHYDENYLAGGINNCPNPTCCRRSAGVAPDPNNRAGPWGDYNCNTPWQALENTLQRIRSQHPQIDLIYHTGDMVDHGIWETSEAGNRRVIGRIFDLFRQIFPNVPVYSTIGNHEAHPTNLFAPSTIGQPAFSTRWLYDFLASTWQNHGWITAAAANTVRAGGYYTVVVRPGFRLVVLNNNDCYVYNWWVMYSRTEIAGALQWFHNTLLDAERNNERVHILAHIPTGGGSCFQFWSRQYRRIIDRFHMIIGAQFNGHSHRDEFEVNYDVATGQHAVNVAWNGGSSTAYTNVNPNYRMYYVDRTHYQVNEAETFIYSISEARNNPAVPPRWFQHYSFRQAFGINNFSPAGMDQLVFNISRNRNIGRTLFRYRVKDGDPRMQAGCNDDCLRSQVCSLVVNEHADNRRCNQVLAVFGTIA